MPGSSRSSSHSGGEMVIIDMNTTSGCWTCRIRRKKCDQQRDPDSVGGCGACSRLDLNCLGYAQEKPEWLKGKGALEAYRESIHRRKPKLKPEASTSALRPTNKSTVKKVKKLKPARPKAEAALKDEVLDPGSSSSSSSRCSVLGRRNSPHPHDFQPDVPHITTLQSTVVYWDVAYKFHSRDPAVAAPVSGIIHALLQAAPLSPLAQIATAFPYIHTRASLEDPARHRTPPRRESAHARICRQLIASYRTGSQVTDDHVLAVAQCVGIVSLALENTEFQPMVLALVTNVLQHSSIVPNQPLSERGPLLRGMVLNSGCGPPPSSSGDDESGQATGTRQITGLVLWRNEQTALGTFSMSEFRRQARIIQSQIYGDGFNTGRNTVPLTEDDLCEDIRRASALLNLHRVINHPDLDAPNIGAGVELVIGLLRQLGPNISAENAHSLVFPIAIAMGAARKEEQRAWLDEFSNGHDG